MPMIELSTGATLDVLETGNPDGQPVVLIHGLLGTGLLNFADLIDWLAPDYRVIAPTLRGYGESLPKPRDFPARFYQRDADDVLALLDALELTNNVRLMGFSDGGETALCLASTAPERFESVLVWGAVGHFGPEMRPIAQRVYRADWLTPELMATHHIDNADSFALRWIRAFHQIIDLGGDITLSRAEQFTMPLMVILGDQDTLNPVSYGEKLVEALPNGKLVVLPCGHNVHKELPAEFKQAVVTFWGG